jgi:hypothetical protein
MLIEPFAGDDLTENLNPGSAGRRKRHSTSSSRASRSGGVPPG